MNDPIDPSETLAVTGGGAAGDAATAVVRHLPPTSCDRPVLNGTGPDDGAVGAAVGAPVVRLSSYRRCDPPGSRWRFNGRVEQVAGAQAELLRGELAVVVRDLLAWASDARKGEARLVEDGEAA